MALRVVVGAMIALVWALYMLALIAVGSCDAFGGRCDGTSPPLFDDDVAGGAFIGTVPAVWALWWLVRPSTRRAILGAPVSLLAAVVAVFVARGVAHG